MTRPGPPSSRGRHSAPEEGAGRHAAPEPARHAAPESPPARRRHAAAEDDALPAERHQGVPGAFRADPDVPSAGFPYAAPLLNGHGVDAAPDRPLNGHGAAPPVNGHGAAPVNGHGAAPVNGHGAAPVNGHGLNGSAVGGHAWPLNGHAAPEEPEPPVNGSSAAWPLNGNGEPDSAAGPINGHVASEPPVNGSSAAWPLNGNGEPDSAAGPINGHVAPEPPVKGDFAAWPIDGHGAPESPVNGASAAWTLNGHRPEPVDRQEPPPVDGHLAADGSAPAPLAGWQREPFRPTYPAALPREAPVVPREAQVSPRAPTAQHAAPVQPPATARPAAVAPPVAPPRAGAPAAVAQPAAFALDGDDESTQVLRRFVPASETLGREKSETRGRPPKPPHPPRAVVRRRQARRRRLEWPFLIVFALLSAYLIRAYVVQTFYIPSASMHETLLEGDRVLVNKISYHVHDVHRGDVVVFAKPPRLAADEDDLIKRVVGLPGETIEGRGGKVYVNGAPLTEPYVAPSCGVATSDFAPQKVPAGDLWVMGDNRCNSSDSRVFGVISEKTVVGRAFVLVWPVGRFSGL